MNFKSLFCRHSWTTYYYHSHRSCKKCNKLQVGGYTLADDDWYPPTDEDVKKAFIFLMENLGFKKC